MTDRTTRWLGRASLFVLSGALISAGPAFGQSATDQATTDQTATAQTSTDTLQEVVVTAERRAENVQTTPISVVAISGGDLQAQTVLNVNTLTQVAPDLTVQSAGNSSMLDIRGLGTEAVGIQVSGVVVTRDGIPNVTGGTGLNTPFYDIADVEVLRGPQGTFSGGNSTGGAVNINSQDPNFRGINGYVTAKVGTYSDIGVQGAVNLPVSDTFAMRLAFNEEQRNSFYYDEGTSLDGPNTAGKLYTPASPTCPSYLVTDTPCASSAVTGKSEIDPGNQNDKDVRLGLLWKPTDNFQSLTKLEIDDSTTNGDPTQPNTNFFSPIGPGQPCPTGHGTAPNCTELYYSGYSGSPRVINSWLAAELDDQEVTLASEELRYTLPTGTVARFIAGDDNIDLTSLSNPTADSIDISDGNPNDSTTTYNIQNAEFDLISPTTGAFSWIAGASWLYSSGQLASFSTTTTPPYSPATPAYSFYDDGEQVYTKTEGLFGQTTWQINPTLQFQIGARVSWDRVDGHGGLESYRGNIGLGPIYSQATGAGSIAGAADNAVPTGKVGLNWTPVQGQYFYAFWARGYTPGLENLGDKPPTTKSWVNDSEFGWKGTMANGHVLTQVSGYYMQYYQLIQSLFNIHNVAGTVDGNIPFSIVKGLEASMQSHVGQLSFDIGADLNKSILGAVVTAKTYAFPSTYGITNQCASGVTPNAGNTNCTNYLPYLVNLSGEQLPFSPLFQGNASLRYSIPVGEAMNVSPRVTYSYIGKSYASLFQNDNYFLLPSHSLVNAYVDWTAGPYTTTIYATNLANKLYLTSIASTAEYYGAPRQLGLQVNRTF
ncbi:MAG TPA: TonB-dependent receptor [Steroidobacteraceae bacterium]|jgi:iron complex outermembrane receptor protein|nr:TonB-dependent receptor [Steroidobacteraceae bacterium]